MSPRTAGSRSSPADSWTSTIVTPRISGSCRSSGAWAGRVPSRADRSTMAGPESVPTVGRSPSGGGASRSRTRRAPSRSSSYPTRREAPGEPWTVVAPEHGVGELAMGTQGRRLAFTTEVDPARFLITREPSAARRTRSGPRPARPADHSGRLALGRTGSRRPLGAPLRRSEPGAAPGRGSSPRATGASSSRAGIPPAAPSSSRPTGRRQQTSARRRRSGASDLDAGEPVEVMRLGGPASHPAVSPDGRWLAAVGVTVPRPARRPEPDDRGRAGRR